MPTQAVSLSSSSKEVAKAVVPNVPAFASILDPHSGAVFEPPVPYLQTGLGRMKKVDVVSGTSFTNTGARVIKFHLPTEGIVQKDTLRVILPCTLSTTTNQAHWARGNVAQAFQKIKVTSGSVVIHEEDFVGLRYVKHQKYTKSQEQTELTDASASDNPTVYGYYDTTQDSADTEHVFTLEFPEDHFLSQKLPLFLLTDSNKIQIELTIDDEDNNYTRANTGSNARILTITSPYILYRNLEKVPEVASVMASGYSIRYADHHGEQVVIANNATNATFKHTHTGGRFAGAELHFVHNADRVSETATYNLKYWAGQKNTLSKAQVFWQNGRIVADRDIQDIDNEAWELARMWYPRGDPRSWSPFVENWGATDGDFCLCLPVSALNPKRGHSGYKDSREFKVVLTYATAGEAIDAYAYYKTVHTVLFKGGALFIDQSDFE